LSNWNPADKVIETAFWSFPSVTVITEVFSSPFLAELLCNRPIYRQSFCLPLHVWFSCDSGGNCVGFM
jgi:hypothetical protein